MSTPNKFLPSWLEPASIQLLSSAGRMLELRPGRPIPPENGPAEVCMLGSGLVRIARHSAEHEVLAALVRGPALLGHLSALSEGPTPERARTLTACTAFAVSAAAFRTVLARDARVSWAVSWELAERALIAQDLHAEALAAPAEARVARLLLDYAALIAQPVPEGRQIGVRLSQERLAEDLGLSRRSTGTALRTLRAAGLIQWAHGRCVLRDQSQLEARATTRRSLVRAGDLCPLALGIEHSPPRPPASFSHPR